VEAAGLGDAVSELLAGVVSGPVAARTRRTVGRASERDRTARHVMAMSQGRREALNLVLNPIPILNPILDIRPVISQGNIRTVAGLRDGLSSIERLSGWGLRVGGRRRWGADLQRMVHRVG
jgi:hypothetical protein